MWWYNKSLIKFCLQVICIHWHCPWIVLQPVVPCQQSMAEVSHRNIPQRNVGLWRGPAWAEWREWTLTASGRSRKELSQKPPSLSPFSLPSWLTLLSNLSNGPVYSGAPQTRSSQPSLGYSCSATSSSRSRVVLRACPSYAKGERERERKRLARETRQLSQEQAPPTKLMSANLYILVD